MDIKSVYDIAGRAMAAQLVRLNTVASNLANAGSTTGDPNTTYKPLKPIFETQYSDLVKKNGVATTTPTQPAILKADILDLSLLVCNTCLSSFTVTLWFPFYSVLFSQEALCCYLAKSVIFDFNLVN